MRALTQAQRRYDRQLPAEANDGARIDAAPVAAPVAALAALRADLERKLDAQDISSAFNDRLIESDDDIQLLRAIAVGNDAAVLCIVRTALLHVALQRMQRG